MPVEIKELIIRTNVTAGAQAAPVDQAVALSPQERRRIIEACTREVVRQVQKQDER